MDQTQVSKPNGAEKQQAVVNEATATPTEIEFPTITLDARTFADVKAVIQHAKKRNMSENFVQWALEMIHVGSKAQCRSWEYSDTNVNLRAHAQEKALLSYDDPQYAKKVQALDLKYGVGGKRVEVG